MKDLNLSFFDPSNIDTDLFDNNFIKTVNYDQSLDTINIVFTDNTSKSFILGLSEGDSINNITLNTSGNLIINTNETVINAGRVTGDDTYFVPNISGTGLLSQSSDTDVVYKPLSSAHTDITLTETTTNFLIDIPPNISNSIEFNTDNYSKYVSSLKPSVESGMWYRLENFEISSSSTDPSYYSNGQFSLPNGIYYIESRFSVPENETSVVRIQDVTNNNTLLYSSNLKSTNLNSIPCITLNGYISINNGSIEIQIASTGGYIFLSDAIPEFSINFWKISETPAQPSTSYDGRYPTLSSGPSEPIISEYTLTEETDSSHPLGAGFQTYDELTQINFSSPPSNISPLNNSVHTEFAFYHSSDFYVYYNRHIYNERNGFLANSSRPYHLVGEADLVVNNLGESLGTYFLYQWDMVTVASFMINSNSSTAWCSPTHGRYNGGCFNGSTGQGDWKIYIR